MPTATATVAPEAADRGNVGEPLVAKFAARIKKAISTGTLQRTPLSGGNGDGNIAEVPPTGLILAGFKFTYQTVDNNLMSVTPIYWTMRGTQQGATFGDASRGQTIELMAKPGYAVAGLQAVRYNVGIDSLQVQFAKLGPNGFDPEDSYLGEIIGDRDRRVEKMQAKQNLTVGFYGALYENRVAALGLVQLPANPSPKK